MLGHIDFTERVGAGFAERQDPAAADRPLRPLPAANEDFKFPDLLGAAYEYLIGEFADSAGTFYTPRPVARMMRHGVLLATTITPTQSKNRSRSTATPPLAWPAQ